MESRALRRWAGPIALAFLASGSNTADVVIPSPSGSLGDLGRVVAFDGDTIFAGGIREVFQFDSAGNQLKELVLPAGNSFYFVSSLDVDSGVVCIGDASDTDNGLAAGAVLVFDAGTGLFLTKLLPSDGAPQQYFGRAVATNGSRIVAGAIYATSGAQAPGAAYVFDAATGAELAKLFPSDPAGGATFGWSLALDGDALVVGAPLDPELGTGAGAAYLFDLQTGTELHKLLPDDGQNGDQFGTSVAIHGTTIVVGAPGDDDGGSLSGSAYVFDRTTGAQLTKLVASDADPNDFFGQTVAVGPSGRTVIGAYRDEDAGQFAGSAYLFDVGTGAELAKYLPSVFGDSTTFGWSVAIGDWIAVGAPGEQLPGADNGTVSYFSEPVAPEVYCTAKPSSAGCLASIGTSDPTSPPCSGANDYSVTASGVQELKVGLLFGGIAGPAALPFNNGTLCVAPPLARGLPQLSGGTNAGGCAGTFDTTVNDGLAFPSGFDVGAGGTLWAQYWYRDPLNGAGQLGTALSDAVQLDFE